MPAHFNWPRADKRREFLRVRRNAEGGLDLFPNQSSGVLTSVAWGDGLVDNPPGQTIARGDAVSLHFLRGAAGMKLTVKYFASIREALGQGGEAVETSAANLAGAARRAGRARRRLCPEPWRAARRCAWR